MPRRARTLAASQPAPSAMETIATEYLADPTRSLTLLADRHGVSRQAVSAMLRRAEADGLIPKRPADHKSDTRIRDAKSVIAALASGASVAEAAASAGATAKFVYRLIEVDDHARTAYESGRERAKRERDGVIARIRLTIAWRESTEAAAALAIGITPGALSQILTGRMALHPELVERLASALKVPLDWLRSGERRPAGLHAR